MALWVQVTGFANGEYIEEDVLNRPIRQLRERTDLLYSRINDTIGSSTFEALRVVDVDLTDGSHGTPEVKDVVYLDQDARAYTKAIARTDVDSNLFQTADASAYAVGVLVSKSGDKGTVLTSGKLTLATDSDWDLSDLLVTDEEFRPGPYYLSSVEAGKLTAYPKGMAIYIGYFTDSQGNPGSGGIAMINPQYKDVGEAHLHRPFALTGKPAGTQSIDGTPPNATHRLQGHNPESASQSSHGEHDGADDATVLTDSLYSFTVDNYIGLPIYNVTKSTDSRVTDNDTTTVDTEDDIVWDDGDEWYIGPRSKLVIVGPYASNDSTTYTLTLTDSTGLAVAGSNAPSNGTYGFEDAYLKWESSDPDEGSGLVRITGYEIFIPFGTKGCSAILENMLEDTGVTDKMWGWCEASTEDLTRRQWILTVPDAAQGWRARKFRQYAVNNQTTDGGFSLVAFGTFNNSDENLEENLTIAAGRIYKMAYTDTPSDGDTITIGGVVYEFDDDGILASSSNIPVVIDYSDQSITYTALKDAIREYDADDVHVAIDTDESNIMMAIPEAQTVTLSAGFANATLTLIHSGSSSDITAGDAVLLVYNADSENQVEDSSCYWDGPEYFEPVELKSGLKLMFIPFDQERNDVSSSEIVAGDYWTCDITDEAPGAVFEYAVDMDVGLRNYYPPIPLTAASLVVNGIEMESHGIHANNSVWRAAYHGLYWYKDAYSQVPWPYDWVSENVSVDYPTLATLYLVHMRVDDTSVVTSLQPAPNSALKVMRCGTSESASTGDLTLDFELQIIEENTGSEDYQVIKGVRGSKLLKGPVVSKVRAGSGVSISSPPGTPEGTGLVTIGLANSQDYAGDFSILAYRNAKQEMIGVFPYTKLLGWEKGESDNVPTGLVAQFQVPYTLEGQYQVYIYLTVFGESDIAYNASAPNNVKNAGLTFEYSVLRDYLPANDVYGTLLDNVITPANGATNVEIPFGVADGVDYTDEDGNTVKKVYGAYDPMVVHNNASETDTPGRIVRIIDNAFPVVGDKIGNVVSTSLSDVSVRAGSMVAIELQRGDASAASSEYTSPIGITQLRWRLTRID